MAQGSVGGMVEEVYAELRRVADGYVRRERAKSVQASDLVHDVYMRLKKDANLQWQSRSHFVAIAAIAMRRLLVERARARGATKRGGQNVQVTLEEGLLVGGEDKPAPIDLIGLDQALGKLAELDPLQSRIVELRYFGGLSVDETAEALDISAATVKRHWTVAKAYLLRELGGA